MNDWLYLLLIPALLVIVWFWPDSRTTWTAARRKPSDTETQKSFHAVSIEPCSHACDAARALRGKRFLTNEVMSLPVPGCDESRCQCTYKHYADRRVGEERRRASIAMRERFTNYEQRHGGDRRRRHAYL